MSIINFELEEVSKICSNVVQKSQIIACNSSLVRIDIKQTESRQITVCLRFPENYPEHHLLVELKSRTLSSKFLDGLTNLVDQKAKEFLGKPQIIHILKFLAQYLAENPLCIIYDEIFALKQLLKSNSTDLKLKQRTSSVILIARGGKYFFKLKVEIPEDYPRQCIVWKEFESNLPQVLIRYLNGQSKEIARQCVEPPLRQRNQKNVEPFVPRPSLLKALKFIIEATGGFSEEKCPVCKNVVLPKEPETCITDDSDPFFIERVYCGHLFHQGCLKKYMQEPPFPAGGKLCPAKRKHPRPDYSGNQGTTASANKTSASSKILNKGGVEIDNTCGLRLAHDRWVVNIKVAEARWAQKQARERELEEVVDFLQ